MNDPLTLMLAVERVVRPIDAPNSTKLRMREELYGHLLDSAQSMAEQGMNRAVAEQRAIENLGDTSQLTNQLQRTVPRLDRWTAFVERTTWKQPVETSLHFAIRMAGWALVEVATAALLLWVLKYCLGFGHREASPLFPLVMAAEFVVAVFIYALAIGPTIALVSRGFSARGDVIRVVGLVITLVVVTSAGGALFTYLVSTDLAASFREAVRWAMLGCVFVLMMFIVALLDWREKRRLESWLALDVAG